MTSDQPHEPLETTAKIAAAWHHADPPSIRAALEIVGHEDEQAMADALAFDAEHRWRLGIPGTLDCYLAAAPELMQQPATCRALLMVELVARMDEPPASLRQELLTRLPGHAQVIDQVFALCSMLREVAPEDQGVSVREPGTRLGKYVLEWRLGAGAFGEAWQAFDTTLERHVALKILRSRGADRDAHLQQVLTEARAAAALDHPAIVRVHEAGQFPQTGEGFIDSQLIGAVRGEHTSAAQVRSLEDRLSTGPLAPREAAMLIAPIARGVAMAHARGITHRDIKPANILIGTDGTPLLADFGLSISHAPGHDDAPASLNRIAGTPAYMAPEVAMRQGATPLSDVYSLGATLRALLTGKAPFQATCTDSDQARAAILTLVRTQPLGPLREAAPGVHATLARICDRATSFAPSARYESAERFASDLEAFIDHRPVSVHPVGLAGRLWLWHQRNRLASTVGIAAALALTAGTIGFVTQLKVERDRALVLQIEASRQRDAAIAARGVVETMNEFVARTFNSTRGLTGKAQFTVADAIQLAAERAGLTFSDRPLVEASVRHFLGQAAIGSGNFELAAQQLERAMELRRELLGPTHRDTVATLRQQAELLAVQGKPAAALELYRQVAATLHEPVGSESPDMLRALTAIAGQSYREARIDEALATLERVVAGYTRLKYNVGADHQSALNMIVSLCSQNGMHARAIAAQEEIVALNRANLGDDDISTLNAAQALGWVHRGAGDIDRAIASYEYVLPRYERLVGNSHVGTMHAGIELATLLAQKDPARALTIARGVWESAGTLHHASQYYLRAKIALGRALVANSLYPEARQVLEQAVDECIKERGVDHIYTTDAKTLLATVPGEAAALPQSQHPPAQR